MESTPPEFFKACPIFYALRDKVDKEISCLVAEGLLESVKTVESAAPIMHVLKH